MTGVFRHPEPAADPRSGTDDARGCVVKIASLSQTGALIESLSPLPIDHEIELDLPCVLSKRAIIIWAEGERSLCEFLVPLRFQDVERCYTPYTRLVLID